MMYTRDRVQGLRRRSNCAHETSMRSRRFVALFGGRTADGLGELRGKREKTRTREQKGTVVAIVEAGPTPVAEGHRRNSTHLRAQLGGKQ